MIKLAMAVFGGVVLGGVVHLSTILALPTLASRDAYSRLSEVSQVNTISQLPEADAGKALLPWMDPAFATAVCRYDLAPGPIKLSVPVSQSYTSVSFYTDTVLAYYAINDRSAGRRVIELDLMSAEQRAEMPDEEDVTSADRLIIESPTNKGVIVIKALAAEPGLMAQAKESLKAAKCGTEIAQAPAPQTPARTKR